MMTVTKQLQQNIGTPQDTAAVNNIIRNHPPYVGQGRAVTMR